MTDEDKLEGNVIIVSDNRKNRYMVHGVMSGISIKQAIGKKKYSYITGLDKDWGNKKILCILIEEVQ